jgi:Fe-S-cluster containining protein
MNLCAKCAQHERTCCQRTEVYVTPRDRHRIAAHTGRTDFWEYRVPVDPAYVAEDEADPIWHASTVRPDGTRAVLRHQDSGDCTFLTATGCMLPTAVRPLVCRLFPYDYTAQGLQGTVPGCPLYLLTPGQTLLEGIGIHLDDAQRWHRQLYSELQPGGA